VKNLAPICVGVLLACQATAVNAQHQGGGFSGPDTSVDGRGASCERGNASFCSGGGGGSSQGPGGGNQGGGGGNPNPPGLNRNANSNINTNNNANSNTNTNTNNNTNNNVSNANAQQSQSQNVSANGGKGGTGGRGGRGGNGYGGSGGRGGNATATANANGGTGGTGIGGNAKSKQKNRQVVRVSNTGNTNSYYRGDTPVAPLAMPGAPARIGSVSSPLPTLSVGGFLTSIDDPWGNSSGDSVDAGFSLGINIPLGNNTAKKALDLQYKGQLASYDYKMAIEIRQLENAGYQITADQFPQHYQWLTGLMPDEEIKVD